MATPALTQHRMENVKLWYASAVRDGTLLIVELDVPRACDNPTVRWQEQTFKTFPVGMRRHALLPVSLGSEPGDYPLSVQCGDDVQQVQVSVQAGDYPESQLRVDPKYSKAPPPRHQEEKKAIEAAFASGLAERLWRRSFVRPALGGETSPFGVRRTFNGVVQSRHRGVDLQGAIGDPIYAANDGRVALVADDFYFVGNAVFLDHGDGLFTLYLHLSEIAVKPGQLVKRGALLGKIGSTGRVTGPHLHFAARLQGKYVDPGDLLAYRAGLMLEHGAIIVHR